MLQLLKPPRVEGDATTVCVIGLGRVGLPTAVLLAAHGQRVLGVDVDRSVVASIDHFAVGDVEPGLGDAVRTAVSTGMLTASREVQPASSFIIAVPTPLKEHRPDLSHIRAASSAIAPVLEPGNLVVLESTVPPGTTEKLTRWLAVQRPDLSFPHLAGASADIRIAHCPERVLPGQAMHELVHNDRVIGGITPQCARRAAALFKRFVKGRCHLTDAPTAELVKLAENGFRDVNIAFANELSMICENHAVDVWQVRALANRHPRVDILQPGPGVGGHCIAVDPWFLAASAPDASQLVRAAREVNDAKPAWVIGQVMAAIAAHLAADRSAKAVDVSVACYGLAYKPDTDDLRESPALAIVTDLAKRHAGPVLVVEPHVERLPANCVGAQLVTWEDASQADIHVVLVSHSAFRAAGKPTGAVLDICGLWRRECAELI